MFCQRCGAPLPLGANFCPNCGLATNVQNPGGPFAATPAAAPIETCTINLRWQQGTGFVPGWFEGDVSGPSGNYIAGTSKTFSIIPGDPFWLNNNEVRSAQSGLVNELTAAGWVHIGQATPDWWTAQFRRRI